MQVREIKGILEDFMDRVQIIQKDMKLFEDSFPKMKSALLDQFNDIISSSSKFYLSFTLIQFERIFNDALMGKATELTVNGVRT